MWITPNWNVILLGNAKITCINHVWGQQIGVLAQNVIITCYTKMATWHHTYIKLNDSSDIETVKEIINNESYERRSIARENKTLKLCKKADSHWLYLRPYGYQERGDSHYRSCEHLSKELGAEVITHFGQGNCSAMLWGHFKNGELVRSLGSCDGEIYDNFGEPFEWEPEVFGAEYQNGGSLSDASLRDIAEHLQLPGYKTNENNSEWEYTEEIKYDTVPEKPKKPQGKSKSHEEIMAAVERDFKNAKSSKKKWWQFWK